MRITLREKASSGMTEEERCDTLFSLLSLIEDGGSIGSGPEEILVDNDGRIHISRLNCGANLALQAPEVVLGRLQGEPGKPQAMFMLGMLAYFLCCKEDYYVRTGQDVLEVLTHLDARECVISPQDAANIPYGDAVSLLTAVSPENRSQGVAAFLRFLTEHMPETAIIRYVCQNRELYRKCIHLTRDNPDLIPDGTLSINGTAYRPVSSEPICIPYRPGTHTYTVELMAAEEAEPHPNGTGRGLWCSSSYLGGGGGHTCLFPLEDESTTRHLILQMQYPDSRLLVCRSGEQGQPFVLRELPLLRENDPVLESYALTLQYMARDRLAIFIRDSDGKTIHNRIVKLEARR